MAKKHKPEEIVAKLRQVDVLVSQGTRRTSRGKATLLCVFFASIVIGAGIGFLLRVFGWR
jgi:hypothetical protein